MSKKQQQERAVEDVDMESDGGHDQQQKYDFNAARPELEV